MQRVDRRRFHFELRDSKAGPSLRRAQAHNQTVTQPLTHLCLSTMVWTMRIILLILVWVHHLEAPFNQTLVFSKSLCDDLSWEQHSVSLPLHICGSKKRIRKEFQKFGQNIH